MAGAGLLRTCAGSMISVCVWSTPIGSFGRSERHGWGERLAPAGWAGLLWEGTGISANSKTELI